MSNLKQQSPPPGIPEGSRITTESNFAQFHAKSAAFFARKAYECEPLLAQDIEQRFAYECYSAHSIMASCYFLEALINKVFTDSNRALSLPAGAHSFYIDLSLELIHKILAPWKADATYLKKEAIARQV